MSSMNSIIIPVFVTTYPASYQISLEASVQAPVTTPHPASRQQVIGRLSDHFKGSIDYLQKRKREIFHAP